MLPVLNDASDGRLFNDLPSIQLINCTPSPAKQLGTETRPVTGKDAQLDNGMHGQGGAYKETTAHHNRARKNMLHLSPL
jgi:hypothetical protein